MGASAPRAMLAALAAAAVSVAAGAAEPPLAPAGLELLGVVASADPARSTAVLASDGRVRVVGISERAFGAVLLEVAAGSVLLERDGRRFTLSLDVGGSGLVAAAPLPPEPREGEPTAQSSRTLARSEIDQRLPAEIPRILQQTTLVPVRERGGVVGLSLTRFPEDTLLAAAGLRPGDVVTSVEDVPIDSLQALMSLWPRLREAERISAIVMRDGRPLALSVSVR